MARAGYVKLSDAVFEKDGKQIPFRKAHRTRDAEDMEEGVPLDLMIREAASKAKDRRSKKVAKPAVAVKTKAAKKKSVPQDSQAEELLRKWRAALAKKQGVPAFRIMTDKTLLAIAEERPRNAAELLAVPGMGIKTVEKFGAQIYRILNEIAE